jgi:hypothetical protein
MTVLMLCATQGVMPELRGESIPRKIRIDSIERFFEIVAGDRAPTIAQFTTLFGPHNEDEWALQLRFEGVKNPLSDVPSEQIVARVNRRFRAGDKHPSRFLCLLRREMPELRSRQWRLEEAARRKDLGEEVFRVRVGDRQLSFSFPLGDDYIGRLLDDKDLTISAERFLPLCQPGECCP